MLKELRIKNLAIIDDLRVRFESGLNVHYRRNRGREIHTGRFPQPRPRKQSPVGSGKSRRKRSGYTGIFHVDKTYQFPDIGVDISDGLIIRRSISASGKSRAYINDTMVSLQSLAEIGRALVDIHGQHEHQSLLSIEKHRDFLDLFAKLQNEGVGWKASLQR